MTAAAAGTSTADGAASVADATAKPLATTTTTTGTALVVRARGVLAGNVGPTIEIRVNGLLVATTEVRSTTLQDYSFTVADLGPGSAVDIVYTNDAVVSGIDRNLWVNSITVGGQTYASTGSGVVFDRGSGSAAFDGVDTMPGQEGLFWNGALRFQLPGGAVSATGSTGVYIDASAGSDTNPGTQALPWKTLRKATEARLTTGQSVFLRCGQVWRESLALDGIQLANGTNIAGYGTECATAKAVISGADLFNGGWTKSGNVWSRAVPAGTPKIRRLFIDGTSQATARWPNATSTSQGYALVNSLGGGAKWSIRVADGDLAALSGKDIEGATVYARTSAWMIESRRIAGYASGTLTLATGTDYTMDAGEGYVLEDKLWMLDAPGEFFHDTVNNRLYVYPSSSTAQADLNSRTVEGSVRDIALRVANRTTVGVRDIAVRMARVKGLLLMDASGALVERIEASGNGETGVSVVQDETLPGATIRSSRISNNFVYGIDAVFGGATTISDNNVTDTGTISYPGWSHAAIEGGKGAKILNNIVDGTAYHGIRFSGTGGSTVMNNAVTRYCVRLSDCAAIYTWNGPKLTGSTQLATVELNQVQGGRPNAEGAVGPGIDVVGGIFLDDFSHGVTVRNNVVRDVPFGLVLRNGSNNVFESNRVWLPTRAAITASNDQTDRDYLVGNIWRNNQFVPVKSAVNQFPALPTFSESYPIWFFNNFGAASSISSGNNTFTGNQVVRFDGSADGVHAWLRSNTEDTRMSSATWATFNRLDAPTATPMAFALYQLTLGPELVPGGNFDSGFGAWNSWFSNAGSGGSASASSGGGCVGTCVQLTAGTSNDWIASPAFVMRAGAPHLYAYTATLGGAATLGWPYISRNATPWDNMATAGYTSSVALSGSAGQVIRYEAFFTPKSSDLARVNLQVKTPGVSVRFDSVSVREITGFSFSTTADWAAVATAPVGQSSTVTCASLGWPAGCSATTIDGVPVTLPQTLTAGSSQLYLRADSSWRR
ncbi:right-handed parallel beta-helix repeat-containing protein [Roseateles caseinilyticus]|uniref:right-handed parallel beta-helix repeat-containing protein n=1 Tax=Pelomonas caseinilytica TaxID=2906763 RepID=UPI0032C230C6